MDFEAIRAFCLELPGTTEDIKWDHDLCFCIGGKMYSVMYTGLPFSCSFKVTDEEFGPLSESQGIIPAPYMARAKWVQVQDPGRLSREEWAHHLRQSYELVKGKLTKKLRDSLGV